ncbi:hypothetical protein LMG18101_05255 [Ralstonia flaminis]|uniref:Uncharacterized protein n=1 Tax=Ralstonia flaminis TaxID=3058597 RepID=A0ABN9JXJ1_9RALS|nr:hypothetical protein LMG18101_05255 [Ralstonia sp. LMG 18101]
MPKYGAPVPVLLSVARTVKVLEPSAVGVPETTPVLAFRLRPAGSVPLDTAYVYGAVPPVALKVWL